MEKGVRVVVSDDSAYGRRSITRMLKGCAGIRGAGYTANLLSPATAGRYNKHFTQSGKQKGS